MTTEKIDDNGNGYACGVAEIVAAAGDAVRAEITRKWAKYQEYVQESFERLEGVGREFQVCMEFVQSPEFAQKLQEYSNRCFGTALSEAYLEAYEHVSKKAWFLDANIPMSAPMRILEWLDDGKHDVVDAVLADYYRSRLSEIEQAIIASFPARKGVLESAFRAHRNKDYNLAIPVFLAQADGLSNEIYQSHFFRSKESIPAAAAFIKQNNAEIHVAAYAYPLTHKSAIRQPTKKLPPPSDYLNRHAILHGMTSDYGTETNSLKCISLLSYLHGMTDMMVWNRSN